MNVRLFIAITPPVAVRDEIAAIQADAKKTLSGRTFRWQPPEKWHITLQFLGNVRSDLIDDLTARLSAIPQRPPFPLTLAAPGAFPSFRRPRVLWLGFTGDLIALSDLHADITVAASLVPPADESQGFIPHLTLARIEAALHPSQLQILTKWSTAVRPVPSSWIVEEFELWQSTLDRGGSRYTRLSAFSLAGKP